MRCRATRRARSSSASCAPHERPAVRWAGRGGHGRRPGHRARLRPAARCAGSERRGQRPRRVEGGRSAPTPARPVRSPTRSSRPAASPWATPTTCRPKSGASAIIDTARRRVRSHRHRGQQRRHRPLGRSTRRRARGAAEHPRRPPRRVVQRHPGRVAASGRAAVRAHRDDHLDGHVRPARGTWPTPRPRPASSA